MRLILFHNAAAGRADHEAEDLCQALQDAGHEVKYQCTGAGDPAVALRAETDMLVCAGGDGTVAGLVMRMLDRAIPLAVLPLGTGNNFATSLGISGSSRQIIQQWPDWTPKPIDLGIMFGKWGVVPFLESAGFGLFAEALRVHAEGEDHRLVRRVAHLGKMERGIALLQEILKEQDPWELKLEIDGEDCSGEYLLAMAANIPYIGANLPVAAKADPGDGKFDVVLARASDREAISEFLRARRAGEDCSCTLPVRQAHRLKVEWSDCPAHLDDEAFPESPDKCGVPLSPVEFRLHPNALRVLAPPSLPESPCAD